jgi:cobalt-zinc-cadmium efflux system outer membrane protein
MTWDQVRQRFDQNNPTLLAGELNIDESKAQEITAFLRPNPQFTVSSDGTQVLPTGGGNPWQPFVRWDEKVDPRSRMALSYQ